MSAIKQASRNDQTSTQQRSPKSVAENSDHSTQQQSHPATLIQRAGLGSKLLFPKDVLQLQRAIGNQSIGRLLAGKSQSPLIQREWDGEKCPQGGPPNFNPSVALAAANFEQAVYVNTSANGETRQAFAYVEISADGKTWRVCVVGHIHPKKKGGAVAGNSYIPGWANWQTPTPPNVVKIIAGLKDGGTFPEENRYPHLLSVRRGCIISWL